MNRKTRSKIEVEIRYLICGCSQEKVVNFSITASACQVMVRNGGLMVYASPYDSLITEKYLKVKCLLSQILENVYVCVRKVHCNNYHFVGTLA